MLLRANTRVPYVSALQSATPVGELVHRYRAHPLLLLPPLSRDAGRRELLCLRRYAATSSATLDLLSYCRTNSVVRHCRTLLPYRRARS